MRHYPVDLRSDTVTKPTEAMRRAMATAEVGDDVFGEDPTTNRLQERVAELLGKDAALFVPSGTMGNQLALAVQATAGDEVIVDRESHILHYETGAPSLIARVQLRSAPLQEQPARACQVLTDLVRPEAYYYPRTRGVCIENTHNRSSGAIMPLETIQQIGRWCAERGLFLHCDGARLWNASVATGIPPAVYAAPCTTVMVCLSKGLGAPVGSMIAGPEDLIAEARRWRKMLGGGMRQSGVLAAAGLYALDQHLERLAEDHRRAKEFAQSIVEEFELMLDPPPTNIVLFRSRRGVDAEHLLEQLASSGVLVSPGPPGWLRAVFHLDISDDDLAAAIAMLHRIHRDLCGKHSLAMNT
uniref:Threonine aldolase n=1 Tax=uncultured Bacteroidota bacterium TaxID=152509 RepID=H5SBN3_9BACT|nr:threonine aldolase [uncultured Bacteroidetes bacterium]